MTLEPIHVFFHVATLNKWSYVYDQMIEMYKNSSLSNFAKLHVCSVGVHWNKTVPNNATYINASPSVTTYEFPTLKILWDHCQKHDGTVLYLHTKGATRNEAGVHDWRNMMMHFNVNEWQNATHHLIDHDAVGCNLQSNPQNNGSLYFAGNFWWANANYIKTLPDPANFTSRIVAEYWINMNRTGKLFSLHDSNVDHYRKMYPVEKYIK